MKIEDSHHSTQHLTIKVGLHCTSDHFKDREMGCVKKTKNKKQKKQKQKTPHKVPESNVSKSSAFLLQGKVY